MSLIIENTTNQEHDNYIDIMAANLDIQDNPKVGIFWYDVKTQTLFGVVAVDKDSYVKPNAGGGKITCRELHRDIWKKEWNKQHFKLNDIGPFVGDYKDTPRGRVFYDPELDEYEICVGDWIKKHPEAIKEVKEEFNLENQFVRVKQDWHWDIGSGWEG